MVSIPPTAPTNDPPPKSQSFTEIDICQIGQIIDRTRIAMVSPNAADDPINSPWTTRLDDMTRDPLEVRRKS